MTEEKEIAFDSSLLVHSLLIERFSCLTVSAGLILTQAQQQKMDGERNCSIPLFSDSSWLKSDKTRKFSQKAAKCNKYAMEQHSTELETKFLHTSA